MDKYCAASHSPRRQLPRVEHVAASMGIPESVLRLLEERGVMAPTAVATPAHRTRLRLLAGVLVMGISDRDSVRLIWGPS